MAHDHHRTTYHFQPEANWMNDPNGLIRWGDDYHIFYQYNPAGPFHGTIHWGHAVSQDLLHWEQWPIALAPTPGGADKDGVYSGCGVDNDGVPTLVYTGISPEVQMIATSADGLRAWTKHPANPVIAAPPPAMETTGFRDPFVWREADGWYCVIGSGEQGRGGVILLYRSPDLVTWDYLHPLLTSVADETGTMWECPNFFPLGDKYVLLISPIPLRRAIYAVGRYEKQRFTAERWGEVDPGGCYYAPQVMTDRDGRRLLWGWLWEERSQEAQLAAGWSGVLSLPRQLSLAADGSLHQQPAPELTALRRNHHRFCNAIHPGDTNPLAGVQGHALEILVELNSSGAESVSLDVAAAPDGSEATTVRYSRVEGRLSIDRSRSNVEPDAPHDVRSIPLVVGSQEVLRLHVFLDASTLEVYAHGQVLTSRIYPRTASTGVAFSVSGGSVGGTLDVWTLDSIR